MEKPFYISEEELPFISGFNQAGWYYYNNGPFQTKEEAEQHLLATK